MINLASLKNKDSESVIKVILCHYPRLFRVFELNTISKMVTNVLYNGAEHPGVVIIILPSEYDLLIPLLIRSLLEKWVPVRISKTIPLSEQKDWCERNGFILDIRQCSTNRVEIKRPR